MIINSLIHYHLVAHLGCPPRTPSYRIVRRAPRVQNDGVEILKIIT